MANICMIDVSVKGLEVNVKEFVRAMKWQDEYKECGVGRIFDVFEIDEFAWNGEYYAKLGCDVAWSVKSAMRNASNPNNLETISERLSLTIEIFSREPGMGFMEHFVVENGKVLVDDCFDYYECDINEFEETLDELCDDFWEQDFVVEAGATKENYMEFVHDGCIEIGGCDENWEYV